MDSLMAGGAAEGEEGAAPAAAALAPAAGARVPPRADSEDGVVSRKDRAFMDDFLLSVLEQKDELQDQVYDLTKQLVETKAKLGMMEFEHERSESQRRMLERKRGSASSDTDMRPMSPVDHNTALHRELQAKTAQVEELKVTVAQLEQDIAKREQREQKSSRRERLRRTSSTNKAPADDLDVPHSPSPDLAAAEIQSLTVSLSQMQAKLDLLSV